MQFKKYGSKYILRLDKGEEIVETLKKFCVDEDIKLGTVQGIGATNDVEIGGFETDTKEYHSKKYEGDYEIAPLLGNITTMDGEVYLHIHINLAGIDNKAISGHLNSAVVSATFECVIHRIDGEVDREFSNEIGLNLLEL